MKTKFEDLPQEIQDFVIWTEALDFSSQEPQPDEWDLWVAEVILEALRDGCTVQDIQKIWENYQS